MTETQCCASSEPAMVSVASSGVLPMRTDDCMARAGQCLKEAQDLIGKVTDPSNVEVVQAHMYMELAAAWRQLAGN